MSRDYPDLVDPWKAADGQREFQGTMPLDRMKRLTALIAENDGEAAFRAAFYHDRENRAVIRLQVSAELVLICQRTLKPYTERVERRSRLGVIEDLAEQETLPADYEPVLVDQHKLALIDLVEDELLLGVPDVPRDPNVKAVELSTDGEPVLSDDSGEPRQTPFAGLADLMKGKAET